MIPNGSLQLHAGDKLLIISEAKRIKNLPMCPRAALWSRMAIGTWANSHIIQLSNSMIFNAETITAMV